MALNINRDWRLPAKEFFPGPEKKSGICIHHTVGGSARSTFNWWMSDEAMVGTAYLIDHDGTVYEVFDPKAWAWQFGLPWRREEKIKFEKRFVGIEIASEGGLMEQDGQLYCFDKVSERTKKKREEAFDYGKDFRGYRYFDKYEPAQIDSLAQLISHLTDTLNIPKQVPDGHLKYYGDLLKNFEGIIGHTMVRKDKSDPLPDMGLWETLKKECGLQWVDAKTGKVTGEKSMTDEEKQKLFESNIKELNKMNIAAGSMIKGLIMELRRDQRDTYIRLHDAEAGGHKTNYTFVQGDAGLVFRIGYALGFKNITDKTLEVMNV